MFNRNTFGDRFKGGFGCIFRVMGRDTLRRSFFLQKPAKKKTPRGFSAASFLSAKAVRGQTVAYSPSQRTFRNFRGSVFPSVENSSTWL